MKCLTFLEFRFWNFSSVAGFASRRGWPIEKHYRSVDWLPECVARRACDLFMASLEREICLVVIEEGWPPFVAVVAAGAIV